jgi:hypothetical protein
MAGRITVAEYDAARAEAVEAYVDGVAEATLATGEKNATDRASAKHFVDLGVVWTNAPDSRLGNTERMRDDIESDFEDAKDGAERAVLAIHDARTLAAKEGRGRVPALTQSDAKKNSTKGIRQRKIVLENTVECIQQDPALARSAYKDAASKAINWTELCAILANPLLTRAQETRMKVVVGIAKDGRRRLMTEDYAKTHAVETRELDDGTTEEFTTTTFGPKGDTEDVEVIIHLVPSGELLTMALDDLARRKKLQAADNSVVRKLMEQARLPEFMIREARPKSSDR